MKVESYRDNVDTPLSQVLGRLLGGVASDTANLEFLREPRISKDGIDDGTTLVAGGAKNSDQLGHDGDYFVWRIESQI